LLGVATLGVVAGLACASKSPPKLETICKVDSDCVKVGGELSGEHVCCFACDDHAATKASAAAFDAWCGEREPLEDCPEPNCVMGPEQEPHCDRGRCEMVVPRGDPDAGSL